MATRTGNSSDNLLIGTTFRDIISDLGGQDFIYALDGNDTVSGGAGNDLISGGNGNDTLQGNEGNDVVDGGAGKDLIDGGSGNDVIVASEGSDDVAGGIGNDRFVVHGSSGDRIVVNDTSGIDTLDFSLGSKAATIDMRSGASSFVDGREIVINGGSVTRPLDFVLLEDLSGSFDDDVSTLTGLVPDLVPNLRALQPNVRFGVASFVDKPIGPFGSEGDYVYKTELPLTTSTSDFQNTIANLTILNGEDTPEAQIEALMQLALRPSEIGFRSGALRAVVVATDAPPHVAGDFSKAPANDGDKILDNGGIGEDYPSVGQLRAALIAAGVIPIFAVTAGVIDDYKKLVGQLGFGTVVTLSTDSSDIVRAVKAGLTSITTTSIENVVGTAYADSIEGNDLNNLINGGGGADKMSGGKGNDTYVIDNARDQAIELNGQGTDTVLASVSYSLKGQAIENLTLTGSKAISAIGNSLANTLTGNAAANRLDGGLAADVLRGNAGKDTFVFSTALGPSNVDRIADFSVPDDTIHLSNKVFSALGAGALSKTAFKDVSKGGPVDADDRILYNSKLGTLSYDADGAGGVAAVRFAVLDNKAALTAADFFIV